MSTATATATTTTLATATTSRRHSARTAAVASGVAAAVAVTALAAIAGAAGVPLAVGGEAIPLAGFAQLTLIGAVLGGLMAAALDRWTAHARRVFVVVSTVSTLVSCVPSIALPQDLATKIVLAATHLVAAVVVVPALARQIRR
jgi:hypothetical protein